EMSQYPHLWAPTLRAPPQPPSSRAADHLVVDNGRLVLEQEVSVLWIVLGNLKVVPGKALDSRHAVPERHGDEVSHRAVQPCENVGADVARHGAVVRDRTRVQE